MSRVIVYEANGKYYSFRCENGGELFASAMGSIVFKVDAPTPEEASQKAREEARTRGIDRVDCLLPSNSTRV